MQTTVEKITPAVASKMLDRNTVNRPITKSWVNSLTDAMVRGEWKLNGEAIKIASTDQLLDGQHRLLALIAASERGVSHIETLVVRGLPPPVFDTIDQGKKRSAADIFSIAGEKHSSTLAAAVRGIFCCVHARFGGNVSMQQLEAVLRDYPTVRYWTGVYAGDKGLRILFPSVLVSVVTMASARHGDDKASEFLARLRDGVGLASGDPRLILRDKMMESRTPSKHLSTQAAATYIIKAWNAFILGKKMGLLRLASDEAFPVLR
jgi:hypothetical protein